MTKPLPGHPSTCAGMRHACGDLDAQVGQDTGASEGPLGRVLLLACFYDCRQHLQAAPSPGHESALPVTAAGAIDTHVPLCERFNARRPCMLKTVCPERIVRRGAAFRPTSARSRDDVLLSSARRTCFMSLFPAGAVRWDGLTDYSRLPCVLCKMTMRFAKRIRLCLTAIRDGMVSSKLCVEHCHLELCLYRMPKESILKLPERKRLLEMQCALRQTKVDTPYGAGTRPADDLSGGAPASDYCA